MKERINDQWYEVTVKIERYRLPLLARIFGKRDITEDVYESLKGSVTTDIHSCIFRGKIQTYMEIITTRTKISGPKQDKHSPEYYEKIIKESKDNRNKVWPKKDDE